MAQSDAQCGSSSLSPLTVGGQPVAASVSAVDEPPVQSSLGTGYGGMDPVGTFSSSIITVYSGIGTALTVCSASVGPVADPAATVVAIFGDSEQSGRRAQQCQRSQSVTAILSKEQVQTVQSRLFKFSSNIQCSTVAFRVR